MIFRKSQTALLPAIFTLVLMTAAMSIDFGWGDSNRLTVDTREPVAPGYFDFGWGDSEPFTISSPAGIAWADSAPFTINIPAIPAMSAWGVAAMTLLLLTAGTLVYLRRRQRETLPV